jgi:hypothetical protein
MHKPIKKILLLLAINGIINNLRGSFGYYQERGPSRCKSVDCLLEETIGTPEQNKWISQKESKLLVQNAPNLANLSNQGFYYPYQNQNYGY